jgi:hypothetical protein
MSSPPGITGWVVIERYDRSRPTDRTRSTPKGFPSRLQPFSAVRKLRASPHRRATADRLDSMPFDRVLCPTIVTQCRANFTELCVIEMTLATATSALESHFDNFLYAAVREDPDGTPLTVLSILARLDIDPGRKPPGSLSFRTRPPLGP